MNAKISKQIQAEQWHGRQKYGRGPNDYAHDASHDCSDWQELIKIAGLAISAVESFDRERR